QGLPPVVATGTGCSGCVGFSPPPPNGESWSGSAGGSGASAGGGGSVETGCVAAPAGAASASSPLGGSAGVATATFWLHASIACLTTACFFLSLVSARN